MYRKVVIIPLSMVLLSVTSLSQQSAGYRVIELLGVKNSFGISFVIVVSILLELLKRKG
jgi:hypothetical protein